MKKQIGLFLIVFGAFAFRVFFGLISQQGYYEGHHRGTIHGPLISAADDPTGYYFSLTLAGGIGVICLVSGVYLLFKKREK